MTDYMSRVVARKCTWCNNTVQVLRSTSEVYCNSCMQRVCELSHLPDSMDRNRCNTVFDPVRRDGRTLCIGHYKALQCHCRVCGACRGHAEPLSYDNWYYCEEHRPPDGEQSAIVRRILGGKLNDDCIGRVVSLVS